MIEHQITHIRKPLFGSVDKITHVKYDNFIDTVPNVIRKIEAGTDSFYTYVDGKYADVIVVRPRYSDPHLRTTPDDDETRDNLLSLPLC